MNVPRLVKTKVPDQAKIVSIHTEFMLALLPKSLATRVEKWKKLCEKPQDSLVLVTNAHVLTAAFTAIRRNQDEMTTCFYSEVQSSPEEYPSNYNRGLEACIVAEEILWSCGYRRTKHRDVWEKDSSDNLIQSTHGCKIKSIKLTVFGLQDECYDSLSALRKKWAEVNAQLPAEEKRPSRKRLSKD